MKFGKWKVEVIIVTVALCVAGSIWWYLSTRAERQADAQFEQLVNFANRQQVEIAIIKQSAELGQLKRAIAAENQKRQNDIVANKQKLQKELQNDLKLK